MAKWKEYPYKMTLPLSEKERAIMELAIRDGLYENRVRMMRKLVSDGLNEVASHKYSPRKIAAKIASIRKKK